MITANKITPKKLSLRSIFIPRTLKYRQSLSKFHRDFQFESDHEIIDSVLEESGRKTGTTIIIRIVIILLSMECIIWCTLCQYDFFFSLCLSLIAILYPAASVSLGTQKCWLLSYFLWHVTCPNIHVGISVTYILFSQFTLLSLFRDVTVFTFIFSTYFISFLIYVSRLNCLSVYLFRFLWDILRSHCSKEFVSFVGVELSPSQVVPKGEEITTI
jgi:hypothetical protein